MMGNHTTKFPAAAQPNANANAPADEMKRKNENELAGMNGVASPRYGNPATTGCIVHRPAGL